MTQPWTRRQMLSRIGIATAAIHALDPHELCCTVAAHAQTAEKELFELKKVADGVYAAVAAATYKVNSNAAVILTDDGVVVVDSHSKPSAARALYTAIQRITGKPVQKIINTHFHWDHWQGNEVYAATNPGLEIVASQRTRENLTRPDAGNGGVAFIEKQIVALPAEIDKLKADIQRASSPELRARLESSLRQADAYLQELKLMKPALPTRTVSTTVTLNERGREIQLHLLGRAHTDGDLFVYLPKEKVVVTGDAVIDWMPFLNDGYPEEWVQTLHALEQLPFAHLIPGHGDVAGRDHLAFFRTYLVDLIAAVRTAAAGGATLDEMKTAVADQLAPTYERAMSKYPLGQYRDRVALNIEMVYRKVVRKA